MVSRSSARGGPEDLVSSERPSMMRGIVGRLSSQRIVGKPISSSSSSSGSSSRATTSLSVAGSASAAAAMMRAAGGGYVDAMRMLMEAGADVHARGKVQLVCNLSDDVFFYVIYVVVTI